MTWSPAKYWRRPPASRIVIAAALVLAAAAAGFGFVMTGPADRPPTRAETFAATSLRRSFLPLHARHVPPPPPPSAAALLEGRKLYRQTCAICHGGDGRGNAAISKAFYPPVPDLTTPATQRSTDRELFWTVQNGIRMTGMPAWRSTLKDQQIWDVVIYLRRLSDSQRETQTHAASLGDSATDLHAMAVQTIEDEGCRDCHTIDGTGATIGPNLSDEWARGRSDNWLIAHFRHPSAVTPGTPMPSFDHLSDEQLKALVRYLQDPNK